MEATDVDDRRSCHACLALEIGLSVLVSGAECLVVRHYRLTRSVS
jgi:hypothetical protein